MFTMFSLQEDKAKASEHRQNNRISLDSKTTIVCVLYIFYYIHIHIHVYIYVHVHVYYKTLS